MLEIGFVVVVLAGAALAISRLRRTRPAEQVDDWDIVDLPCPWCKSPTREDDTECPSCAHPFGSAISP